MGKEQTVKFIVEAEKGVTQLEKIKNSVEGVELAVGKINQKGIINETAEVEKIGRVQSAFNRFEAGVDNADKGMTKLFKVVWKIGRTFLLMKATMVFIKALGIDKTLKNMFFKDKKFGLPSVSEIVGEGKKFNQVFAKAFTGVFERSSVAGGKAKLFKNMLDVSQGKQNLKNTFQELGESTRFTLMENHPIMTKFGARLRLFGTQAQNAAGGAFKFRKQVNLASGDVTMFRRILNKYITGKNPYMLLTKGALKSGKAIRHMWKTMRSANNAFGDGATFIGKFLKGPKIFMALTAAIKLTSMALSEMWSTGKEAESAITMAQIFSKRGTEREGIKFFNLAEQASMMSKWTPMQTAKAAAILKSRGFTNKQLFEQGGLGVKGTTGMQTLYGMAAAGGDTDLTMTAQAMSRGQLALLDRYTLARDAYFKLQSTGLKQKDPTFKLEFVKELAKIPEHMRAAKIESVTLAGAMSTISGATSMMFTSLSGVKEESKATFSFWSSMKRILNHYKAGAVEIARMLHPFLTTIGSIVGQFFEVVYSLYQVLRPILILYMLPLILKVVAFVYILKYGLWIINKILKTILEYVGEFISQISNMFKEIAHELGFIKVFMRMYDYIYDFIILIQMTFQMLDASNNRTYKTMKKVVAIIKSTIMWLIKMFAKFFKFFGKGIKKLKLFYKKYTSNKLKGAVIVPDEKKKSKSLITITGLSKNQESAARKVYKMFKDTLFPSDVQEGYTEKIKKQYEIFKKEGKEEKVKEYRKLYKILTGKKLVMGNTDNRDFRKKISTKNIDQRVFNFGFGFDDMNSNNGPVLES